MVNCEGTLLLKVGNVPFFVWVIPPIGEPPPAKFSEAVGHFLTLGSKTPSWLPPSWGEEGGATLTKAFPRLQASC